MICEKFPKTDGHFLNFKDLYRFTLVRRINISFFFISLNMISHDLSRWLPRGSPVGLKRTDFSMVRDTGRSHDYIVYWRLNLHGVKYCSFNSTAGTEKMHEVRETHRSATQ
jgi:hypothetical protein